MYDTRNFKKHKRNNPRKDELNDDAIMGFSGKDSMDDEVAGSASDQRESSGE